VSGVAIVRVGGEGKGEEKKEVEGKEQGEKGMWRYEQPFAMEGGGTAKAVVMPPSGAKCPRCWRYKVEKVDDSPAPSPAPTPAPVDVDVADVEPMKALCSRCEVAVGEQQQK
jgi:hypothetical protein